MKNERKKINAVDIFFVLLALGVIIAILMRGGYLVDLILGNRYNVTYTLKISTVNINDEADDGSKKEIIAKNENVINRKDGSNLGVVIENTISDSVVNITTASGSTVVGTLEGMKDITLTVNADVLRKNDSYVLGNSLPLKEGIEIDVIVGDIYAKATIIDIQFTKMTKK